MKVILKQNVEKIGFIGDVVEVNKGYARNYLFPKELAMPYTTGNLKSIEHAKKKDWEKRNRELNEAQQLAEKIGKLSLSFKMKAGKDGKLFGSVTHKDIAESLARDHQIDIDRKKIEHNEPLKKIGQYQVSIHLHKDVNAKLNVSVEPEEEKEAKEEKKEEQTAKDKNENKEKKE